MKDKSKDGKLDVAIQKIWLTENQIPQLNSFGA